MSNLQNEIISEQKYEDILNNDGFLNDLWNEFDATTKVEILQKAGVNLEKEWDGRKEKAENRFNSAFL